MVAKVFVAIAFAYLASAVSMTPIDEEQHFDCPPNEKYYKCSLEACYTKCDHLVNMPPCASIAAGCYKPACICIEGYLRNDADICVPVDNCPKYSVLF